MSFFQARSSEEGRLKQKLNELLEKKVPEKVISIDVSSAAAAAEANPLPPFTWANITPTGKGPAPRWGHSANAIGKKIHIFGGSGIELYGDYCVLDIELMAWLSPLPMGSMPSARFGHSATSIGSKVFIFGGQGTKQFNDLYILDTESAYWTRHSPDKNWPEPRAGHTLSYLHGRSIDVAVGFGGHNSKQKYLNDVYVLEKLSDSRKPSWTFPTTKETPPAPRSSHSATAVGDQLYVFGGFDGKRYFNDVHVLDAAAGWTWRQLTCSGKAPTPRSGHSATLIGRMIFVIGGCGTDSAFFNDVFVLHLDSATWQAVSIASGSFEPRFKHSAHLIRGDQLCVFGGTSAGALYSDLCSLTRVMDRSPTAVPLLATDSWQELDPQHWVRNPLPLEAPVATTEMYMSAVMTLHAERDQRIMLEGLVETLLRSIQTEKEAKDKTSARLATLEGDLIAEQEARKKADADRQRLEQVLRSEQEKRTKLDKTAKSEREKRQKQTSARETAEAQLERVTKSLREMEARNAQLEERVLSEQQQRVALETELAAVRRMHQDLDASHAETLRRLKRYLETFRAGTPAPTAPSTPVVTPVSTPVSSSVMLAPPLPASAASSPSASPLTQSVATILPASAGSSPAGSRILQAENSPRLASLELARSPAAERLQRIVSAPNNASPLASSSFEAQQQSASPSPSLHDSNPEFVQLLQRPIASLTAAELSRLERQQLSALERIVAARDQKQSALEAEKQRLRVEKIILEERENTARKALTEDRKALDVLTVANQQLKSELATLTEKCERLQREGHADPKLLLLGQASDALSSSSTQALDSLEEHCHTALRRIAAARQEKFRLQLEELKREKEQLQEARKCIVCTDREIGTVILPCGHRVLCRTCAGALEKCPICRTGITKAVDTY